MLEIVAKTFVLTLEAYAGVGLLFALLFVSVGVQRSGLRSEGIWYRISFSNLARGRSFLADVSSALDTRRPGASRRNKSAPVSGRKNTG